MVVTKITRAFISQGKIEIRECFWLFSPGFGEEYFLGGSRDGNEWIYVERASESWF